MCRIISYIFGLIVCFAQIALTQQQVLSTQFMFNKAAINPAYVGNDGDISLTAIFRNQWIGLSGAPSFQQFTAHMPLSDDRIGIGLHLNRTTIGISKLTSLEGMYSYKMEFDQGILSMGMQVSFRNYVVDFSDSRLTATDGLSQDLSISQQRESKYLMNAGLGVYFNNEQYYAGFSLPRLFNVPLDFDESIKLADEVRHGYLMAGTKIYFNDEYSFLPQFLLRFASHVPVDYDLNLSLIIQDRYTAGLTYRAGGDLSSFGESIDLIFSAQITPQIQAGFSYDITLSELGKYSSGSTEVVLRYVFGEANKFGDFINPRYF